MIGLGFRLVGVGFRWLELAFVGFRLVGVGFRWLDWTIDGVGGWN